MIHPALVKPGTKFVDDGLTTVQPAHRIHRITDMLRGGFKALHYASGTIREYTQQQLANLRQVPGGIDAMVNLDWLVGETVRVTIIGTGTTITGTVTAINYHIVPYVEPGQPVKSLKFLASVELDKSSASCYEAAVIERLELIS